MGQGRADDARLAVMQRAHGVVEVSETGGAGLKCRHAFFIAAQGVADLQAHAALTQGTDQRQVASDFRGDSDHLDWRQGQVGLDFLKQPQVGEVRLRAELARVDVRSFEVHTQHPRAVAARLAGVGAEFAEHLGQFFLRRGHGGGQQRSGAKPGMRTGDGGEGSGALHHIAAAAAVNVQVDETGQQVGQIIALRIARLAVDGGDAAVTQQQASAYPARRGEYVVFAHGGSASVAARRQSRSSRRDSRCRSVRWGCCRRGSRPGSSAAWRCRAGCRPVRPVRRWR
ncbi:hypothetical protein D3C80_631100 [compost metagenome]